VIIKKGKQVNARRTLLYGVHGIGKSTWAAQAPSCLMLNLEDGLDNVDCDKTEVLGSIAAVGEALAWLVSEKHSYKTVAIDTADWLEALIHQDIGRKANKDFADIGFGNGYKQAITYWDTLCNNLDLLRKENGMQIILLAHSAVKKYSDPEQESYDRYQPALHESASALLQEWCDEVLFASYRVFTKKEDLGFNKERKIAIGGTERFIRTQETAACLAKNRLDGIPAEIGFSWAEYSRWFPVSAEQKKESK
jgi:hypothetical protein